MNSKKNICFVVNNFNVGGLEKVVLDLINHIDRNRFEMSVVCLDGAGKLFDQVNLDAGACLVLNKSHMIRTPVGTFDPASLWRMRGFFHERTIDIVHAHNMGPLAFGGVSARLCFRRPIVVYSEHNQFYSASPRARSKFALYIRLADHVVTVSHDLKRTLEQKVHPFGPIRVIHNGIDGSKFAMGAGDSGSEGWRASVRAELGVTPDQILIGAGVVLSKQKGLPYLLEAAREVIDNEPRALFALAGDGPLREELRRIAADYNLGDRFQFLGYRDDMPRIVAALDIYALSSLWEGLPLSLVEALAMGKPIVATQVGGNCEVVDDWKGGITVPARDATALARALLTVCQDENFRARCQIENRDRFEQHFSLQSMVKAHETLYEEVAGKKSILGWSRLEK